MTMLQTTRFDSGRYAVGAVCRLARKIAVVSMGAHAGCHGHILSLRMLYTSRNRYWHQVSCPDVVSDGQWDVLPNPSVFECDPLVRAGAELVFLRAFEHQAAASTQTNSWRVVMDVPVGNAINGAAATNRHALTHRQPRVQGVVSEQAVLSENEAATSQTGPTFVQYLRLHLRNEIDHLLAHDQQDITLPVGEIRRVLGKKKQQVLLRLAGEAPMTAAREAFGLLFGGANTLALGKAPEIVVWRIVRRLFRVVILVATLLILALDAEVGIYVFFDSEHRIQKTLDLRGAVIVLVLANTVGIHAHLVNHVRRRVLEVHVILEHVSVAEHMRHHDLILEQVVLLHQKSIRGIGVDHQLINLAQAIIVLRFHAVVRLTARPVAETTRQAIGAELIHDGGGHQLEMHRVRIQVEAPGNLPDFVYRIR